jgi:hypothetical protein
VACLEACLLLVMPWNHNSKVMFTIIGLLFGDVNELQLLLVWCVWKRVLFW